MSPTRLCSQPQIADIHQNWASCTLHCFLGTDLSRWIVNFVKLIGALVNWLLLGVLTMQICGYSTFLPSFLPCPDFDCNRRCISHLFPTGLLVDQIQWYVKFQVLSTLIAIVLSLVQHMAFIC